MHSTGYSQYNTFHGDLQFVDDSNDWQSINSRFSCNIIHKINDHNHQLFQSSDDIVPARDLTIFSNQKMLLKVIYSSIEYNRQ